MWNKFKEWGQADSGMSNFAVMGIIFVITLVGIVDINISFM